MISFVVELSQFEFNHAIRFSFNSRVFRDSHTFGFYILRLASWKNSMRALCAINNKINNKNYVIILNEWIKRFRLHANKCINSLLISRACESDDRYSIQFALWIGIKHSNERLWIVHYLWTVPTETGIDNQESVAWLAHQM